MTRPYIFVAMEERLVLKWHRIFLFKTPEFLMSHVFPKLWARRLRLIIFCFLPKCKILLLIAVFNQKWFLSLWDQWRMRIFFFCLGSSAGTKRMKRTSNVKGTYIHLGLQLCCSSTDGCATVTKIMDAYVFQRTHADGFFTSWVWLMSMGSLRP